MKSNWIEEHQKHQIIQSFMGSVIISKHDVLISIWGAQHLPKSFIAALKGKEREKKPTLTLIPWSYFEDLSPLGGGGAF